MTVMFTLAVTGLMGLVSAAVYYGVRASAERQVERILNSGVRRVRLELAETSGAVDAAELVRESAEILERTDTALLVVDASGRVLANSHRFGPRWPESGDDWRIAAVDASNGTVVIGHPWFRSRNTLRQVALALVALLAGVALCSALGAWVLIGRVLSPIGALARQAENCSLQDVPVLLKPPSTDAELVVLVATLNHLLEKVTRTAAARGRFYAAASHELRTPLQALSGHLELALHRPRTREEYLEVVEEAYAQTRRFSRLVQGLLLLNRLEQQTSLPAPEEIDLVDIIDRICRQMQEAIASRRLLIRFDPPEEAVARVPVAHAEVVLRNLLENAAKYAQIGSTVEIDLRASRGTWCCAVRNECDEAIDLRAEQVFEPFYRPDASRTSGTGGNGLGLAICKAVSDANGWALEWSCRNGGVIAQVSFPATIGQAGAMEAGRLPVSREKGPCVESVAASR